MKSSVEHVCTLKQSKKKKQIGTTDDAANGFSSNLLFNDARNSKQMSLIIWIVSMRAHLPNRKMKWKESSQKPRYPLPHALLVTIPLVYAHHFRLYELNSPASTWYVQLTNNQKKTDSIVEVWLNNSHTVANECTRTKITLKWIKIGAINHRSRANIRGDNI